MRAASWRLNGVGSFDLKGKAILLDQSIRHKVDAFNGFRWSLVAFHHPDFGRPRSDNEKLELRRLGFRLASCDAPSTSPPTRVKISKANVSDPACVYIGRGSE